MKALASLRICADSPDPSLLTDAICTALARITAPNCIRGNLVLLTYSVEPKEMLLNIVSMCPCADSAHSTDLPSLFTDVIYTEVVALAHITKRIIIVGYWFL